VPVNRREVVKYFEQNGYRLLREGNRHSIYSNGLKTVPIKRHQTIDRITANQLCKQAGLTPRF
jgi:mRNA interferase HicA